MQVYRDDTSSIFYARLIRMSLRLKVALFSVVSLFIVCTLMASIYIATTFIIPRFVVTLSPTMSPLPISMAPPPLTSPDFVPFELPRVGNNQVYYDDTITAYIDGEKPMLVVSTYTRHQKGVDYYHTARVSFFDGKDWYRNVQSKKTRSAVFVPNDVIRSLNIYQAKDRVLRQEITSDIVIDRYTISIDTDVLENESTVRSEPSYTRIFSDSTGSASIDGTAYPARILYTKWYSADNSQVPFYDSELNLETHVFDFWAEDGSVLHLDATDVQKPSPLYSPHKLGIYKDNQKRVAKTFELVVNDSGEIPPTDWDIQFLDPLHLQFTGKTFSVLKRSEGANYNWYRGLIRGTITLPEGKTVKGTGTFEYILEQ